MDSSKIYAFKKPQTDFVLVAFVTCILLRIHIEGYVPSVLLLVEKQLTFKILCGGTSGTGIKLSEIYFKFKFSPTYVTEQSNPFFLYNLRELSPEPFPHYEIKKIRYKGELSLF